MFFFARSSAVALALTVAACVGASTPAADSAADASPGDVSDATDAEVTLPDAVSTFPPADRQVGVREAVVADVNLDGVADLLVVSTPLQAADRGIFVLLGGTGFGEVHAFIPTQVAPGGVLVADVKGDAHPELLVLGRQQQQANLLIYSWTGGEGLYGPPLTRDVSGLLAADPGPLELSKPVFLAAGRFDGAGGADLVLGDLDTVVVLRIDAWSQVGLDTAIPQTLLREGGDQLWGNAVGAYAVPASGGLDGVVVVDETLTHWYEPGDSSQLELVRTIPSEGIFGHTTIDLDGDAATDLLGWRDESLTAFVLTAPSEGGPAGTAAPYLRTEDLDFPPGPAGYERAEDGAVGPLDDDPRPDVVLVDDSVGLDYTSSVRVLRNVFVEPGGALASGTSAVEELLPDLKPWQVAVADFDATGTGEIRVLTRTGEMACLELQVAPLADLVPCR